MQKDTWKTYKVEDVMGLSDQHCTCVADLNRSGLLWWGYFA